MQEFEHIRVVIQGPVLSYQGRNQAEGALKSLLSIRKYLSIATHCSLCLEGSLSFLLASFALGQNLLICWGKLS